MLVGWDSVDDESYASKYTMEGGELPRPEDWTSENNPPYSYWAFYMYANIRALNHFMVARGMHALAFRPHCGEAGSVSHPASMFLLADAINHGIMLKKSPVLQYLYYLAQVGLALSPLSNNALFMNIAKNPLYTFFKVGLNVSISTDDPLMFHFTDEPLLEEYSVAAHTWKLSPVDLCELARNSVLQSGYEDEFKKHWLGVDYKLGGRRGNCMRQTNVSNIRLQYREDALREEFNYMHDVLALRIAISLPLFSGSSQSSSPLLFQGAGSNAALPAAAALYGPSVFPQGFTLSSGAAVNAAPSVYSAALSSPASLSSPAALYPVGPAAASAARPDKAAAADLSPDEEAAKLPFSLAAATATSPTAASTTEANLVQQYEPGSTAQLLQPSEVVELPQQQRREMLGDSNGGAAAGLPRVGSVNSSDTEDYLTRAGGRGTAAAAAAANLISAAGQKSSAAAADAAAASATRRTPAAAFTSAATDALSALIAESEAAVRVPAAAGTQAPAAAAAAGIRGPAAAAAGAVSELPRVSAERQSEEEASRTQQRGEQATTATRPFVKRDHQEVDSAAAASAAVSQVSPAAAAAAAPPALLRSSAPSMGAARAATAGAAVPDIMVRQPVEAAVGTLSAAVAAGLAAAQGVAAAAAGGEDNVAAAAEENVSAREAAKKFLEVAEESGSIELLRLKELDVAGSVGRHGSVDLCTMDGPTREALQTLESSTHLNTTGFSASSSKQSDSSSSKAESNKGSGGGVRSNSSSREKEQQHDYETARRGSQSSSNVSVAEEAAFDDKHHVAPPRRGCQTLSSLFNRKKDVSAAVLRPSRSSASSYSLAEGRAAAAAASLEAWEEQTSEEMRAHAEEETDDRDEEEDETDTAAGSLAAAAEVVQREAFASNAEAPLRQLLFAEQIAQQEERLSSTSASPHHLHSTKK